MSPLVGASLNVSVVPETLYAVVGIPLTVTVKILVGACVSVSVVLPELVNVSAVTVYPKQAARYSSAAECVVKVFAFDHVPSESVTIVPSIF